MENILLQQNKVAELEPLRQKKIREGLLKLLEEKVGKDNFDNNRMEQELIYYIEKIDISEEQVRLLNHCDYFRTILNEKDEAKGKKYRSCCRRLAGKSTQRVPRPMTHYSEMCCINERRT
jgi:uncharacterized protein YicC (UPF0701 family)